MSSTHGIRNKDDYYATPEWIVREFLESFDDMQYDIDLSKMRILDPSAGGCANYGASYPTVFRECYANYIDTMDIREDSHAEKVCDYLTSPVSDYDMIITNPPFSLSVQFAEKAISEVHDGGYVILLQRLNWLGSKKRKKFWDSMPLKTVAVHHRRPSFKGTSGTDSIEYAHFVFQKNYIGDAKLIII